MRTTQDAFHLAIPAADLDEAYAFYVTGLGCKLARRYDDRITLDFFGDQVVCHLSEKWERDPQLYPRHFGVTFHDRDDFDRLLRLARARDLTVLRGAVPAVRGPRRGARVVRPRRPVAQPPGVQALRRPPDDVLTRAQNVGVSGAGEGGTGGASKGVPDGWHTALRAGRVLPTR